MNRIAAAMAQYCDTRSFTAALLLMAICACGQEKRGERADAAGDSQPTTAAEHPTGCDLSGYNALREVDFAQRAIVLIAKPPYPPEALRNGQGGSVNVDIVINRDGNVIAACALNGPALLQPAAQKAALSCKFKKYFGRTAPAKHEYQRDVITYLFVPSQSEKADESHYIVVRPSN